LNIFLYYTSIFTFIYHIDISTIYNYLGPASRPALGLRYYAPEIWSSSGRCPMSFDHYTPLIKCITMKVIGQAMRITEGDRRGKP
jgi:hypothetical protein